MMMGCDLHDKSMLLKGVVGRGKAWLKSYGTRAGWRRRVMGDLQRRTAGSGSGGEGEPIPQRCRGV